MTLIREWKRKILIKVVKYMSESRKKFINVPSQLGLLALSALALYCERGAIKNGRKVVANRAGRKSELIMM